MVYQQPNQLPKVAFHRYLTDASGQAIGFIRMTGELCRTCNPASRGAQLGVVFESPDGKTEQVLCQHCDSGMTRPRKMPANKRMNDGQR
jgi:hypothetical protein